MSDHSLAFSAGISLQGFTSGVSMMSTVHLGSSTSGAHW